MQKTPGPVLQNLIYVRQNPPSLNISLSPEVIDAISAQISHDEPATMAGAADIAADNIDWDITLESPDIDWDIGTTEMEDNGNGLGPYEIVNASDIWPNSPHKDSGQTHQMLENTEGLTAPDVTISDISWDISVENTHFGGAEDAGMLNTPTYHYSKTEATGSNQDRSPLLEAEYRNKILDDLFEVYIELVQCSITYNYNHTII